MESANTPSRHSLSVRIKIKAVVEMTQICRDNSGYKIIFQQKYLDAIGGGKRVELDGMLALGEHPIMLRARGGAVDVRESARRGLAPE